MSIIEVNSRSNGRANKRLIQETLLALGIAPHYKGFACLQKSLALLLDDEEYLSHICSRLYPDVAEILKSKGSRVERCIRHSIGEAAGKTDLWKKLFQYADPKLNITNTYFLGRVLLYLKNTLSEMAERNGMAKRGECASNE